MMVIKSWAWFEFKFEARSDIVIWSKLFTSSVIYVISCKMTATILTTR